jgi:hypothetical protein
MKRRCRDAGPLCIVIGVLLCMNLCSASYAQDAPRPSYQPLWRLGKELFPVSEERLMEMRDGQRVVAMRAHAWALFAALTNAEGPDALRPPIWDSWYTKCDVHLATCLPPSGDRSNKERLMRGFSIPTQDIESSALADTISASLQRDHRLSPEAKHELENAIESKIKTDPQLASVLYNKPARDHILANHLYSSDYLNIVLNARLQSKSPESEREIAVFPRDAVVLKTGWELILPSSKGLAQVDVWNPSVETTKDGGLATARDWNKTVTIDTTREHDCRDGDYSEDEPIPIGCFYYFQIDKDVPVWKNLVHEINGSSEIPDPRYHPYALLMAVHVTTKEIGDWAWATFWWYNRASYPIYGCDRPRSSVLKGNKWRHFLMDTTLSAVTPLETDFGHKICFNRYMEEKMPHGMVSNCIQCHRRAVYNPRNDASQCGHDLQLSPGYQLGLLQRCTDTINGTLPACRDVVPERCRRDYYNYYHDVLQTDFLWSIAEAQSETTKAIQNAFVELLTNHIRKR